MFAENSPEQRCNPWHQGKLALSQPVGHPSPRDSRMKRVGVFQKKASRHRPQIGLTPDRLIEVLHAADDSEQDPDDNGDNASVFE